MTDRIAAANGNFGTAATWDSPSNTPTLHASTVISISTTALFTAAFTAPSLTNACTGALIHIGPNFGGPGTVTVTLQESTVDTAAAVSIVASLFAVANHWIYFRFPTPYTFTTLTAGSYRFKIQNSSATTPPNAAADSGGANIAYIATDDRQVVPVLGDNLWIVGHNQVTPITVTLDGTRSCGSGTDTTLTSTTSTHTMRTLGWAIQIQNLGKLQWDTAADAWLTCRGTIAIGYAGELNIGTVATPMPAARLGRLTMDVITSSGLYGIFVRDSGKMKCQGAAKSSTTLWKAKYVSGTGTAASPLVVNASVDWSVGDEIFVGATSNNATNYNETETKFIITKNSATSYVISNTKGGAEAALSFTHTTDAWVINVERNVLIDALVTTRGWQFYNDSIVAGDVDLDWARFETLAGASGQHFSGLASATGRIEMDYCVWYRALSNRFAVQISNSTIAHTFTGLIVTGATSTSNSVGAFNVNVTSNKTLTDCFFIKNNGIGLTLETAFAITINTCSVISNNTGNVTNGCGLYVNGSAGNFNSCEVHANRIQGVLLGSAIKPRFTTCNIGNKGINAIDVSTVTSTFNDALFISCVFGSATLISNYLTMLAGSEIKFHQLQGTTNNHFWYTPGGSGRTSGAGLSDTNVRTAGTLNAVLRPENATDGQIWEFNVLARASSLVSASGFIQKNAAFSTDPVTVDLYLPGSTTPDNSYTMPNNASYNPFSVFASYSGTVPALATVRITAKSVTAAAYAYVADLFNGTNDITNLKTWHEAKPAQIMFEQLGDAQAVWSALKSVQTTPGQMGYEITADLDDIQTRLQTIDDFLDTEIAAILAAVDTEVAAIKAKTDSLTFTVAGHLDANTLLIEGVDATNQIRDAILTDATRFAGANIDAAISSRATPAQVNAEVVDALATDTYPESAGVPAATASIKDKIAWLATLARNKITQTATTQTLRNDGDSGNVGTAPVSDDGTTATRSKWS